MMLVVLVLVVVDWETFYQNDFWQSSNEVKLNWRSSDLINHATPIKGSLTRKKAKLNEG